MKLHIVLVEPEIPANTGNISRTCSVADMPLHLVHPLGFDISEKQVRRAGLDYWDELDLNEYQSFDEVMQRFSVPPRQSIHTAMSDIQIMRIRTSFSYSARKQRDCPKSCLPSIMKAVSEYR